MKYKSILASAFLAVCALGFLGATPAEACFTLPATYSDSVDFSLTDVIRSRYSSRSNLVNAEVEDPQIEMALDDPGNRIHPLFHVPEELYDNVAFWLRIYTQYSSQQLVLFDSRHTEVIYEAIDFRDLALKARNAVVYEILVRNATLAAKARYHAAFARLARNPRRRTQDHEERMILAGLKKLRHHHSILDMSRHLRSQIGQRDPIIKGILAAERFFPKMESIFTEMNLPKELTRIVLVESSFNTDATSRVGAADVWQFMPRSGKEFLVVDDRAGIDERLSPLKATVAAAKLLRRNYRILQSWPLTITSYNHGVKNLNHRGGRRRHHVEPSDSADSDEEGDFSEVAQFFQTCGHRGRLGWASRNYYSEFLAILYADAYRDVFYGESPTASPPLIEFMALSKAQSALSVALDQNLSINEIRALNPDIQDLRRTLPKGFVLAIPADRDNLAQLTIHRRRRRSG